MSVSSFTKVAAVALGVAAGGMGLASAANAEVILTFGQSATTNTITGTRTGTSTTIVGTNVAVTISQIDAGLVTPISAFFDLNLASTGAATNVGTVSSPDYIQNYGGTFSITSGSGDTGTNYLSGTLSDIAIGAGKGFTLTASTPGDVVTFTSDVIADLGLDRSASFSFSNVTPGLKIVDNTFSSFKGSVAGTMSGEPPAVPEPASLALLGVGLFGLGMVRRKKNKA